MSRWYSGNSSDNARAMRSSVFESLLGCPGNSRSCTMAAARASGMNSGMHSRTAETRGSSMSPNARRAPRPAGREPVRPFGLSGGGARAGAGAQRLDEPQQLPRLAGLDQEVIEADRFADHAVGCLRSDAGDGDEERRELAVARAQLARHRIA